MKIAVMSDFHFGYNDDALTQAGDALRKARGLADFVIAAGDLFDSRIPRQEVVNDSVRLLKRATVCSVHQALPILLRSHRSSIKRSQPFSEAYLMLCAIRSWSAS